jgi:hypothetical protein
MLHLWVMAVADDNFHYSNDHPTVGDAGCQRLRRAIRMELFDTER